MPSPEALLDQARAFHRSGDLTRAIKLYQQGLKDRPRLAPALYLYALALRQMGRPAAAAEQLRRAAESDPGELAILQTLSQIEAQLGRYDESLAVWEHAIRTFPARTELRLGLAGELVELRRAERAVAELKAAQSSFPTDIGVLTALARIYERLGSTTLASELATRILELSPRHADATTVLARLARRDGRLQAEERLLRSVIEGGAGTVAGGLVLLDLGANLEKTNRFDDAFACFVSGKETLHALLPPQDQDPDPLLHLIRACKESPRQGEGPRVQPEPPGFRQPVFVVGFPRSGTTLLEQVLAAHPSLHTSDELPLIANVRDLLQESFTPHATYPQWISHLSRKQIDRAAASYFQRAAWLAGSVSHNKRLVDKQPLNLISLCLIRRLFPNAPIIMVIRDPRDTVLSCFSQPMKNIAAFYNLHHTASLCAAFMDLWLHYKESLGGPMLEVRYEELVRDTPSEARRLLNFIGEPWDESVLRHFEQSRFVGTPSYQDVSRPVYTSALERWKKFSSHLEPTFGVLDDCLKRLGYW